MQQTCARRAVWMFLTGVTWLALVANVCLVVHGQCMQPTVAGGAWRHDVADGAAAFDVTTLQGTTPAVLVALTNGTVEWREPVTPGQLWADAGKLSLGGAGPWARALVGVFGGVSEVAFAWISGGASPDVAFCQGATVHWVENTGSGFSAPTSIASGGCGKLLAIAVHGASQSSLVFLRDAGGVGVATHDGSGGAWAVHTLLPSESPDVVFAVPSAGLTHLVVHSSIWDSPPVVLQGVAGATHPDTPFQSAGVELLWSTDGPGVSWTAAEVYEASPWTTVDGVETWAMAAKVGQSTVLAVGANATLVNAETSMFGSETLICDLDGDNVTEAMVFLSSSTERFSQFGGCGFVQVLDSGGLANARFSGRLPGLGGLILSLNGDRLQYVAVHSETLSFPERAPDALTVLQTGLPSTPSWVEMASVYSSSSRAVVVGRTYTSDGVYAISKQSLLIPPIWAPPMRLGVSTTAKPHIFEFFDVTRNGLIDITVGDPLSINSGDDTWFSAHGLCWDTTSTRFLWVDVDGNGQMDVISAGQYDAELMWHSYAFNTFGMVDPCTTHPTMLQPLFPDAAILELALGKFYEYTPGELARFHGGVAPMGGQSVVVNIKNDVYSYTTPRAGTLVLVVPFASDAGGNIRWTNFTLAIPQHGETLRVADLNGDRVDDLVMPLPTNDVLVYFSTGRGGWTPGPAWVSGHIQWECTDVGDVNGDGNVDVVYATRDELVVQFGAGGGVFDEQFTYPLSATEVCGGCALRDVDGDGDTDLLFVDQQTIKMLTTPDNPWLPYPPTSTRTETAIKGERVVDPVACGFLLSCIHRALEKVPLTPSGIFAESPPTLWIPEGRYTGCLQHAHYTVEAQSVELRAQPGATVVIDCSGGGGVLWEVVGVHLKVTGVTIKGTTNVPVSITGGQGVRVHSGGRLTLSDVVVEDARSVPATTQTLGQILSDVAGFVVAYDAGTLVMDHVRVRNCTAASHGGFAYVHGADSAFEASHSVFYGNSAEGGGGAVAVSATSAPLYAPAVLTLSNCTFEANSASGEHGGGAVAVLGSGEGRVTVANTVFRGNTASTASGGALAVVEAVRVKSAVVANATFESNGASVIGGAVFVASENGVVLTLRETTVRYNTAAMGGALGVTDDFSLLQNDGDLSALTVLPAETHGPPAPPSDEVEVWVDGGQWEGNAADYGGSVFACAGVALFDGLRVASSAAVAGGGFAFECSVGLEEGSLKPFVVLTNLSLDATELTATWGDTVATPPVVMRLVGFPEAVVSGLPITEATLELVDAAGGFVLDTTITATAAIQSPYVFDAKPTGTKEARLAADAPMQWAGLAVGTGVNAASALGGSAYIRFSITDFGPFSALSAEWDTEVGACPPSYGAVSEQGQPLQCGLCADGTFSEETSDAACEPEPVCGGDSFLSPDGTCTNCPDESERKSINGTLGCFCEAGKYTQVATNAYAEGRELRINDALVSLLNSEPCFECPVGATCGGDIQVPQAVAGFWDISGEGTEFAECNRPNGCAGGTTCNTHHQGYMCAQCTSDAYSDSSGDCVACPDASVALLGVLIFIIIACAVVATGVVLYSARSMASTAQDKESVGEFGHTAYTSRSRRKRRIPHSLSVAIVFFQFLGLLSNAKLSWPASTQQALDTANAFNLNTDVFASRCTLDFSSTYLLGVLTPVLFAAVVSAVTVIWVRMRGRVAGFGIAAILETALFTVAPLAYIPVSRNVLILFDCTKFPNGKWHLDADLGEECFDATWWGLFPLGVAGTLVFVFGAPVFMLLRMLSRRKALYHPDTLTRMPIIRLYRTRYFFFEIVLISKRLFVVAVSLFASRHQLVLLSLLFLVFLAFLLIHVQWTPYLLGVYNQLEMVLNLALLLICFFGFCFYAARFPNDATRTFFVVLTLTTIGGACLLLLWAMAHELHGMRRGAHLEDHVQKSFWRAFEAHAHDWHDPVLVGELRDLRHHHTLPPSDEPPAHWSSHTSSADHASSADHTSSGLADASAEGSNEMEMAAGMVLPVPPPLGVAGSAADGSSSC